jgi:N6-L-threonylcarbamoyladenine synthase
MKILAIETSCDDTACAVVEDGRHVLASVISSQAEFHAQYGGVIPEYAARQHAETVPWVIEAALKQAECTVEDIDAFAATLGPGLVGALLVGANAAKTLSMLHDKPFLGVHHLQGHIASAYLESTLTPPFLCLLVSGGHTQLIHQQDFTSATLLGQTLDDAVGEAYDKVGRILGLPYPGGPHIDRLAATGDPDRFVLPTPKTQGAYDVSLSGLKTAVIRLVEHCQAQDLPPEDYQADVAAAFQHTVVQMLVQKTLKACQSTGLETISVCGGVAANQGLRQAMATACQAVGIAVHFPKMGFCTDNAAMIGAAAFFNPLTQSLSDDVFSRSSL